MRRRTRQRVFFGVIDEHAAAVPGARRSGARPAASRRAAERAPVRLSIRSACASTAAGRSARRPIDVTSGALVSDVLGVLDYAYRTWTILPTWRRHPRCRARLRATPVPAPSEQRIHRRLVQPGAVLRHRERPRRRRCGADAHGVRQAPEQGVARHSQRHATPDIIGVQEVENLATLQALAARINADAVAAGDADPGYVAYLEEGNDLGGIDVGLPRAKCRVTVIAVVQEGKDATYIDPNTGLPALLNDRPPLVLTAAGPGARHARFRVTVIVNHLRSLSGVDDPADGAPRPREAPRAGRVPRQPDPGEAERPILTSASSRSATTTPSR